MDKLLSIVPYLILIAFSVVGILEYIKALATSIKAKQVTWPQILSPVISTGIAFVGAPIVWGSEILGTIAYIYYAISLAALTLAFTELFYSLIIQTFKSIITRIAGAPSQDPVPGKALTPVEGFKVTDGN